MDNADIIDEEKLMDLFSAGILELIKKLTTAKYINRRKRLIMAEILLNLLRTRKYTRLRLLKK